MEVHQLRYVCAIADTGNFSRAAERCQIAQPSLSQQVLKLEEDLGAKLFDRLGRSIRLTEAGRAFIPRARAILEQMDAARSSAADKNADLRGSVAVGVIPTVAPYLMPTYTAAFREKISRRETAHRGRNHFGAGRRLARSLDRRGHSRAAAAPQGSGIISDSHRAAVRRAAAKIIRAPSAKSLALKDLRGESFVMLRDGHCFRDLSMDTCTRARITPNIAFESGQFSSLLGMVAAGVGVSLVPEMAIDRNAGCRYVRLSDPKPRARSSPP